MKHLRYMRYILRHKWFVFIACCQLGVWWRGLTHDLSKFRPTEWFPYCNWFYGNLKYEKDMEMIDLLDNMLTKEQGKRDFDLAWLQHQKRNRHHWQWWILRMDDGGILNLPMDDSSRREMIADWIGAGRAINGKDDVAGWYEKNRDHINLHPETRDFVELWLVTHRPAYKPTFRFKERFAHLCTKQV